MEAKKQVIEILQSIDIGEIQDSINEYLALGWRLHGEFIITHFPHPDGSIRDVYTQVLIGEADDD